MKGFFTIFRREMAAYFNSPIAYIFIIVFLLVNSALFLFVPPWFAFPRADMSGLFGWLVPIMCIFVPAATMRVWAEDRKDNTIEMLLTFPIKPAGLVLGKFLSAFAFYLIALAGTWIVPLMMEVLGDPDWGALLSGYLGAALLGALFISLGTLISGFCRDQVIAFVLSFLACCFISIVGWDPFVNIIDGTLSIGTIGIGTLLRKMVGMTGHYLPFLRGVIDLTNVLYFAVWTALFLFLNGAYLEGRSRPRMKAIFTVAVIACLGIGIVFNLLIADLSLVRFDVTEEKIFTMSDASNQILSRLNVPVQVRVYITRADKMPTEMKTLQRNVTDKLDEMKTSSNGMIQWKVTLMEATEVLKPREEKEEDKEESIEKQMLRKGIKPFPVQSFKGDSQTTVLIYSSIGIAYKDKEEEIIPQVIPNNLYELEYWLMSTIYKLTRESTPVIALYAPLTEVKIPPQLEEVYRQKGIPLPKPQDPFLYVQRLLQHEKYEVKRTYLRKGDPLPEEYDALFIINPRELNARQKWEINKAMAKGVPTLMAVQNYRWDYSVQGDAVNLSRVDENPGVNEFLKKSGIEIDEDILMDSNHNPVTITDPSNPLQAMFGGGLPVDLPMHIVLYPTSMNQDISITSRMGQMGYLWGTALKLDEEKLKEKNLTATTLFSTSKKAWTIPRDTTLSEEDRTAPPDAAQLLLAALIKGQIVDAYADKKQPPAWPEGGDEEDVEEIELKPGTLIIIGSGEIFSKTSISRSNMDFLVNCADALTLGEELIHIRTKRPMPRLVDKVTSSEQSALWKFLNLGLMNLIVAAAGLSRAFLLTRSRQRYRAAQPRRKI